MPRILRVRSEIWPIRGAFRIARGTKTEAHVVVVEIGEGAHTGRGECVPYPRYGETVESVSAAIEGLRGEIERGLHRDELQRRLPAGAARNALDCALIDLEAKATGMPAHSLLGLPAPTALRTAFTLSLDSPTAMAAAAREAAGKGYGLLKLKISGPGDLARIEAVRAAAPEATLIADANEGWTFEMLNEMAPVLAGLKVALLEQPLPAEGDNVLLGYESSIPLCADESCHTRKDLPRLAGRYSHINVKLDKAGGLTEAIALAREAKDMSLRLMIGCMVSTSLSMAPASLLGGLADFVDLDGPLLLARDRDPGMRYDRDLLLPPSPALWG